MVTIADIIFNNAMLKLKEHIRNSVADLYFLMNEDYPNWDNDEEYVILFKDLAEGAVGFNVSLDVYDFEGTETSPEIFTLWSIHASLDGNVFFWDKDNEEHEIGELSINDLVKISNLVDNKLKDFEH